MSRLGWAGGWQGRGRPKGRAVALLAASVAALLQTGCTTVVVPPPAVARPQPVFILDHGRHTSLVLPHPEGIVRYAYGDWDWYAEVKTGVIEATRAVLWPSRAALGRRLVAAPTTAHGVRQGIRVGIEALHSVVVDADDVARLRAALDGVYAQNRATAKHNPAYDLTFVVHPEPYSFGNNSNHQVARWLRQLGCTVRGSAFWARWAVEPPASDRP